MAGSCAQTVYFSNSSSRATLNIFLFLLLLSIIGKYLVHRSPVIGIIGTPVALKTLLDCNEPTVILNAYSLLLHFVQRKHKVGSFVETTILQ